MKLTKRQDLPQGLWIVATPIGNLQDITHRARLALTQADLILCEDTRRVTILLSALDIHHKRLERMDAHTPEEAIIRWTEELKIGKNLALVSDAGTPGISDPGPALVELASKESIRITPIPGPSAVPTLLSVSGFQATAFTFRGFFPRNTADQEKELELASRSQLSQIFVWFESPFRVLSTLKLLQNTHSLAKVVVGKEITKLFESFFYGDSKSVFLKVQKEIEKEGCIGEWSFAVYFQEPASVYSPSEKEPWHIALQCLLEVGISTVDAAKKISQHFKVSKKLVYRFAIELKESLQ